MAQTNPLTIYLIEHAKSTNHDSGFYHEGYKYCLLNLQVVNFLMDNVRVFTEDELLTPPPPPSQTHVPQLHVIVRFVKCVILLL